MLEYSCASFSVDRASAEAGPLRAGVEGSTLRRLSEVLEAVSGTASKLQKLDLLTAYLTTLGDEDLRIACTYLTGSPFSAGDARTLQVGWSAIIDALVEVSGASGEALERSYLYHGDLGAVAAELLAQKVHTSLFRSPLTLQAVNASFARMAAAQGKGSRQLKVQGMRVLLTDADPLEAKYLIRIITSDMRVGLKEGLLEEAIARAFNQRLEQVRRAHMLRSDVGEVAVLARHGRLADATLALFRPIGFMLAETIFSADEVFEESARKLGGNPQDTGHQETMVVEEKYDGVRAQVHSDDSRLVIYSRTLDEITDSFPELHAGLRAAGHRYIADGEIVAWREDHAIPFTILQQRLRRKDPSALLERVPVTCFLFDLLHLDGQDLLDRPLADRRHLLATLRFGPRVRLAYATTASDGATLPQRFRDARERGNEGLVIKRAESSYQPGRRGRQWMKWKEELATLDVVVVAAEHGHGKRAGVLSDVTFAVLAGDRLVTIGKAYSGLTDEEIAMLTEWFHAHTVTDRGRVKLVEPKIVLEVAFDAVTRSDRHSSGYALRFPRIKRLREDKTPEQISTMEDVARIFDYQGQSRGGTGLAGKRLARGGRATKGRDGDRGHA